jgi:DNA-3-methyladenine glycosylase
MKSRRLSRDFFTRPTLTVAKELLGKFLVRKIGRKVVRAIITETEAYCGLKDLASHASKGRTKRTEIMFGPPGFAYVYLIYGMYYCLNIVTEKENYPAAVLIRGVSLQWPVDSENSKFRKLKTVSCKLENDLNGPGKLCRFLKTDKTLNGEDIIESGRLWIEEGKKLKPAQIGKLKRIGIDYAGSYKDKLWRFFVKS